MQSGVWIEGAARNFGERRSVLNGLDRERVQAFSIENGACNQDAWDADAIEGDFRQLDSVLRGQHDINLVSLIWIKTSGEPAATQNFAQKA